MVAPDAAASSSSATLVKKPRYLNALSGQAFRDLALHESYAVAVTAKGDLLQWGSGFSATADTPTPTLRGQDIVQVALTPNKIYARTEAGKVLIVPASLADQTDTSHGQQLPSISVFWRLLGYHGPGAHFVEMTTANQERKDRKIVAISAGRSHLLALAEDGRALCAAVDEQSNECGQLGGGRLLLSGITSKQKVEDGSATRSTEPPVASDRDIRFDTALKEIPALRNLNIKQMVAGDRHSLALSTEGRVLAWGNNSLGQLGLGTGYSFPTIPAPTEASIASAYPKSSSVKPQALYAGGDTSYFLVERTDLRPTAGTEYTESGDRRVYQDLLAAGNGMYGGGYYRAENVGPDRTRPQAERLLTGPAAMGNGQWNSSGVPVRVKTVSGLQEYNETEQTVQPIPVHSLSISSTHAAVVLSNAVQDLVSKQAFGNDVFVFGHNDNYQLGTGKRSNLSIPQHLPPLPYPVSAETKAKIESQKQSGNIVHEESVHSGTKSHMPHNRLQLASRKDKLEERIVCGCESLVRTIGTSMLLLLQIKADERIGLIIRWHDGCILAY